MTFLHCVAAITPIAAVLLLPVILRLPATRAMPISLMATVGVAYGLWQVARARIFAAVLEGLFISASILWIVFGALGPILGPGVSVGFGRCSEVNGKGLLPMLMELTRLAAATFSDAWPLAAPFVGALGSFIAGSPTFSKMMFAGFHASVAEQLNLPPVLVIALQMLGGQRRQHDLCRQCSGGGLGRRTGG